MRRTAQLSLPTRARAPRRRRAAGRVEAFLRPPTSRLRAPPLRPHAEEIWGQIMQKSFNSQKKTEFGKRMISPGAHEKLHAFYEVHNRHLAELLGEPDFASLWTPTR